MTDLILPGNHYLLTINQDIATICEPLKQYGIVYFNHARFFEDNSAYVLTTGKDSIYNHLNKQYPIDKPFPKGPLGKKFHYFPFLDSADVNAKHVIAYQEEFNLAHPIYFIEKYEKYTDLYIFCSAPNNPNILNFYLNNLEFLEKFKFYFKDKASNFIKKASAKKIMIPEHMWSNYADVRRSQNIRSLQKLPIKHYKLNVEQKEVSVTKREFEALKFMTMGYSIKEAAHTIGISPRTMETYLNNARSKLKIYKKSAIVKILTESNLL